MNNFGFRDLIVYKKSRALVVNIYNNVVKSMPKYELFALSDQIRRASVSVPSNIAEGMSRTLPKEQVHFLEISYGSLMEVLCQLELAASLSYINSDTFTSIEADIIEVGKLLSGLRNSITSKLNSNL